MRCQAEKRAGSVMVLAIVAVAVATTVAVFVAAWLRQATALALARREARVGTALCADAVRAFARDVLFCDTNGYDAVTEGWRAPVLEGDLAGAVFGPEFPLEEGARFKAVDDEESRLPLNSDQPGALVALLEGAAGLPPEAARKLAGEIFVLRPSARREQLRHAPSMKPAIYEAIAPFVTAAPVAGINLNTASEQALRAVFAFAEKYDSSAARTLAAKIRAFRANGGVFRSAEPAAVNADLGGLAQGEMLLVEAGAERFVVESRFFSGVVRGGAVEMVFTLDRETRTLVRETVR